jgi:transglutaminase-like putative cysteine protease
MHIHIYGGDMTSGMKWRGGALTTFDGKRWFNSSAGEERLRLENGHAELYAAPSRVSRTLYYHVDLNAVDTSALFFAGTPQTLDIRQLFVYRNPNVSVIRNDTGSYRLDPMPPLGFGYDAYSLLEDPAESASTAGPDLELPPDHRQRYLQLPHLDPRIGELARTLTAGVPTDFERTRSVERRLRTDYGYTLELPNHEIADPLADFLFTRKKGYCEYFASAMTVMLRTLGIPARLATGFQTGVYNPLSELWLVRASDAHTWVEAWIPGRGWTTFDPTPPDPNGAGLALMTRLGLYVDAAQTFWQEWVVSYDLGRQGALSYRLEMGAHRLGLRWSDSVSGLQTDWQGHVLSWLHRYGIYALLLVAAAISLRMLGPRAVRLFKVHLRVRRVRRGETSAGDATLLYHRMLDLLKRRGYEKPVWFTPAEFAASLRSDGLQTAVVEFTTIYNEWRFGGRTDGVPRLSHLLDELERQEL